MLILPNGDKLEVGIDEAGRGCLAGPVVAAVVCMPSNFNDEDIGIVSIIKDSKKMTRKNRNLCREFIENTAIDWGVGISDNTEIDEINILRATHMAMHRSINELNISPEYIMVDGNSFKDYYDDKNELIDYSCIIGGDNKYLNIACASILAKEHHDKIVRQYITEIPEIDTRYEWNSNVCYGTKTHIDGIIKYGISRFHRKSFGICKGKNITL